MPWLQNVGNFTIYSIGDGQYMQRVLNSVAALSNSGLLIQLFMISMVLGLLIMGFKNVAAGANKLDLGSVLVSFIVGTIMFGMTATVEVMDMSYSPGERVPGDFVVANVPFGVAATGWIVSTTGYVLTEQLEQGFSVPGMEEMRLYKGGFGKSLEWISSLRLWQVPPGGLPTRDDGALNRFRSNLTNYVSECTLPAIEMKQINYADVINAADPITFHDVGKGIGSRSTYLMTAYVDGLNATTELTCAEAFDRVAGDKSAMYESFNKMLAFKMVENGGPEGSKKTYEDSMRAIGFSQTQAMNLSVASATGASLGFALENVKGTSSLSMLNQIMIEQASQQRAVQWSAEETMFRRIMRPMMAFFESLMYALTPFMALAVGLGAFGIQTVVRYMTLSIWVALWSPMLSIIGLYQITAMQNAVQGMVNGMDGDSLNVTSIAAAELVRNQSMEWLASGAALAAWTPALTMMLVFAGAVTASALAGKMGGGDHVNERLGSADVASAPSALGTQSLGGYDQGTGYSKGGYTGSLSSFTVKSGNSSQVASESSKAAGASRTYAAALQSDFSQAYKTGKGWESWASDSSASVVGTSKDGKVIQTPQQFLDAVEGSFGKSSETSNALRSAIAANASGSAGAGAGGGGGGLSALLSGGVSGSTSADSAETESMKRANLRKIAQSAGIQLQLSDGYGSRVEQQAATGNKTNRTGAEESAASRSQGVRDTWATLQSSQDSYKEARASSQETGASQTYTGDFVAGLSGQAARGGVGGQRAQNTIDSLQAARESFMGQLGGPERAKAQAAWEADRSQAYNTNGKDMVGAAAYADAKFLSGGNDTAIGGGAMATSSGRIEALGSALGGVDHAGAMHGAAPRAANSNAGVVPDNFEDKVKANQGNIVGAVAAGTAQVQAGAAAAPGVRSLEGNNALAGDVFGNANARYEGLGNEIKAKAMREAADEMETMADGTPTENNVQAFFSGAVGDDRTSDRGGQRWIQADGDVVNPTTRGGPMPTGLNINQTSPEFNEKRDALMTPEGGGYDRNTATFIAGMKNNADAGTNDGEATNAAFNSMSQAEREHAVSRTSRYEHGDMRMEADSLRGQAQVLENKGPGEGPAPTIVDLSNGNPDRDWTDEK